MTEEKEKGGCLGLIGAFFAVLTAHGGCQKLFKNVANDVHIPASRVEIPAKSNKIPSSSYPKLPKIIVIPEPKLDDKSGFPNTGSYSKPPKPPVIPRSLLNSQSEIIPPDIVVPPSVNWSDSSIKSVKAATDDAVRNATRRTEGLALVGEAKRKFILDAARKAGYQRRKELRREKIFIPAVTVDMIIATSVNQTLEEKNQQQSNQQS